MRHVLLVLALVATFPFAVQAQGHPNPAAAVDSLAQSLVDMGLTAGVGIAVLQGGEVIVSRGYGWADLENRVPATDSTVFRTGSLTKQFTAAAILKLAQEGRLSLNDDLNLHLPDFPTQGHRVTLRHLLNHTAGIRNYTALGQRWLSVQPLELSHEELVALFRDEPFDFAPGEGWSYSNSGYYLLGMVIEAVSGVAYDAYVESELFEPLGLRETRYCWELPLIPNRARGYAFSSQGLENARPLGMSQPGAAGAICSSVRDLLTWERALRAGEVVGPEDYLAMTAPDGPPVEGGPTYGFGLARSGDGPRARIGHSGGINGFAAELVHFPAADLTVAVLANTSGGAASRALLGVIEVFFPEL